MDNSSHIIGNIIGDVDSYIPVCGGISNNFLFFFLKDPGGTARDILS